MNKNKLGIIGGMGPEATVNFYDRIVLHTSASRDQDHIDMVILNHASIIDRTYAIKNNLKHVFLEQISDDIKILENIGVTNIAIPCNTSHSMINDIQKLTQIPIINMIEETVRSIDKSEKVGIMATDGTILSNLYQDYCDKFGISYLVPNESIQKDVMSIIYDDVKALGIYDNQKFKNVLNYFLDNKCNKVILGCTELSGFYNMFNPFCIDAMDCLVKASIEKSGGIYKE